jgi:hypothetical protein
VPCLSRWGLRAAFTCADCDELHIIDDAQAESLEAQANEYALATMPAHATVQ